MRERLGRGAVAATLLATLLVPAAGSVAGPQSKLDAKRAALEKIHARTDVLEADATSLRGRIDTLNAAITDLQIEINALDADIAEIESDVRTEQAKIDATQKKVDRIETAATQQAVILYKTGSTDQLDALLDSESLGELNDRIELLGVAAQKNTAVLVRYHRYQLQVEAQRRELFEKKMELVDTRSVRTKALSQRDELRARLNADLHTLNIKLGVLHDHEELLEKDIARMTGMIQEFQAKQAVEALGTSAQGFIWPLNGAITSPYGYRWGRMHTGIDIDGYTGQPIVASKAGVVIMASYYSGYGNTVIVDHGGGIATLYAHMSSFAASNGQSVDQGQVVGYVGCTGSCTGDHLHFEVRVAGSPVNPLDYLP